MLFPVSDLKKDVRIALDYNPSSDALLETEDIDTLTLEEVIVSKIEDAARLVTLAAPQHLLEGGEPFGDSVFWDSHPGYGPGRIALPDDFLRLVTFKMSDWDMAVTVAITEDDPAYPMQRSRYPGIRGNPQKPVVAIVTQPIGQVLEFFSCTGGPDVYVKRARYIPIPKITDEGEGDMIPICAKLRPAVVYYTAYLVAQATGQADLAAAMLNNANELMK